MHTLASSERTTRGGAVVGRGEEDRYARRIRDGTSAARVNNGLDNLLKTAARLERSRCPRSQVCTHGSSITQRALPTLAEATRGSAVVQAMTFDGADSCPSRLAAAVALVPAEQQCDESLRGGRTQFDVDGAVSGDRF
jgi:hypothetical protein